MAVIRGGSKMDDILDMTGGDDWDGDDSGDDGHENELILDN
jgi:hypothetical protein